MTIPRSCRASFGSSLAVARHRNENGHVNTGRGHGLTLALALLFPAPVVGQHLLYAEHDGAFRLVTRMDRNVPMVVEDDKLVPASSSRFSLRKVGKFGAWYVNVRNPKVVTRYTGSISDSATFNHELTFSAELETGYALDNVFAVVELLDNRGEVSLLNGEVGRLRPRETRNFILEMKLPQRMDDVQYRVHLFSNGIEMLHSMLPAEVVAHAFDQMVAEKLKDAKDGPPRQLAGPPPLYPESLLKARVAGSATVAFEVTATGVVVDPKVTDASDPAFGEAAIAAIREWRFVPKVKGGQPVSAKVAMPFTFSPPAAPSAAP
jgi:TonB family protein